MIEKKRILHILQNKNSLSFQIGQEYIFFLLVYAMAERNDYEITIITPGYNPLLEKLKNHNVIIYYFDFFKWNIYKTIKRLQEFIEIKKFDLVHCHDFFSNFIAALALSNFPKKIILLGSRYSALFPQFLEFRQHFLKHIKAFLEKKIIDENDFSFCITKNILSDYLNAGIHPKKMTYIKPGIDYKSIQFNEEEVKKIRKRVIGIYTKEIKIVCLIGRFERLKNGFDIFAKIVQTMKIEHSDAPVKFAIYGEQSEALQNYLYMHSINDDVAVIENYYSPNDVINAADIILMTYRYCDFPMQLLKSQKFIKPAIVSDIPVLNEIVKDNCTGFVLPVADYISFAEKINLLVNDNELYNKFCENLKNQSQDYTLEKMLNKYMHYYKKYLK